MSEKVCVVIGSSSFTGYTAGLVKKVCTGEITFLNLTNKQIGFFDYQNSHSEDEFLSCIKFILEHDLTIFASPVYWYCISAQMKIFLDRMTDLLYFDKDLMEQLRTKRFAYLSTYSTDPGFASEIVSKTFKYMHLNLVASLVLKNDTEDQKAINRFQMQCGLIEGADYIHEETDQIEAGSKRGRGRPAGSKNKIKVHA